ncbi:putative Phage portal protein [Gammaproteobacteria bacterium]
MADFNIFRNWNKSKTLPENPAQADPKYSLVAFDGMKAVTIWGDEGWSILSGNEKERPDTEIYYAARVGIVFRSMQIRADAVANIPFDLVDVNSGEVVDSTDDWQNKVGFLPNPQGLLWLLESAWVISGRAYIHASKNGASVLKIFKPLAPGSVTYNVSKNDFTRKALTADGNSTQDLHYPPAIDKDGNPATGEFIVPVWMPDPDVEMGPPLKFPGKAALSAMGVLYNLDDAATGFFKRGMLHTYVFAVPEGTQQADKDQFEDMVRNKLTGSKNEWRTLFVNTELSKPIDMGGGLDELANVPLTKEERENVSIAMGIPMSILFSETARGLGGKGVVDADDRRLIEITALPDWRKIAYELNRQIFIPLGYRLVEHHEKMPVFQENETDRSTALTNYVNAFVADPELALIMAQMLGAKIPDDMLAQIETIVKEKKAQAEKIQQQTQQKLDQGAQSNPVANEPSSQSNTPEMNAEKTAELDKFQRKALKHVGQDVEFIAAEIPADELEYIHKLLPGCKTAEDVRRVFANVVDEKQDAYVNPLLVLAEAVNRASALVEAEKA